MDYEENYIKRLQLILLIEEFYKIKITDSEMESIETLDELTELISDKLHH
jgi:acyl carrier protein